MSVHTQVINIINAAQESSPMPVAEALDRVLEILRTTELYSPQLGTKEEDPHTNDLVGGLMTVGVQSSATGPRVKAQYMSCYMHQIYRSVCVGEFFSCTDLSFHLITELLALDGAQNGI